MRRPNRSTRVAERRRRGRHRGHQLARLRRATVIGTASAFKHDALRSFGVDHAIDYRHADVVSEVRKITLGRGADVLLDPIGGTTSPTETALLAPLGRLICGAKAGRVTPVVARTFPLEQAAEAHRFIQARQNIGKVVLTT